MAYYLTAQICLNGHVITNAIEHNPERQQSFCSKCGARTTIKCLNCGTNIRGKLYDEAVVVISGWSPIPPSYCHSCGRPYPWMRFSTRYIRRPLEGLRLRWGKAKDKWKNLSSWIKRLLSVVALLFLGAIIASLVEYSIDWDSILRRDRSSGALTNEQTLDSARVDVGEPPDSINVQP
jgi:hypothetical protein